MAKSSFVFDGPMVLNQLRACGVLETIKISCAGYVPSKFLFQWFYEESLLLTTALDTFCAVIPTK
jgi:myosin-5